MRFQAILFDLDGTLVDSAPDLAGAANDLRAQHGQPPLDYAELRPMAGAGARGMVGRAFGLKEAAAARVVIPSETSLPPFSVHEPRWLRTRTCKHLST